MNMSYMMFNTDPNRCTIIIKRLRCKFTSIIKSDILNCIIKENCVINLINARFRLDNKYICDYLLDASIKTTKYLNGLLGGLIDPQISH